ncbi:MAG: hypothetical protein EPO31_02815 [Gammaproteobacteria bacterium]|nr:MAG: hypothetical protein EPO31_02815 [Gammaproteobacteria bacterium]
MTRSELEHLIRTSGAIANDDEIIIIGSQAILGQFPDAPDILCMSMEADLYPRHHTEMAILVDGAIGEGSSFHELYGYYAQGVGPETAVLPRGWEKRLVRVFNENTGGVAGLCIEAHDLAISKYVAGRPKDLEFTRELARHGLTQLATLRQRLTATKLSRPLKDLIKARIESDFKPAAIRKR